MTIPNDNRINTIMNNYVAPSAGSVQKEKEASAFGEDSVSLSRGRAHAGISGYYNPQTEQRKEWLRQEKNRLTYEIDIRAYKERDLEQSIESSKRDREQAKNEKERALWDLKTTEREFDEVDHELMNVKELLRNPNIKGDERMRLEDKRSRLQDRVYTLKSKIYDTKSRIMDLETRMRDAENNITSKSNDLGYIKSELYRFREQLANVERELQNLA